MCACTCTPGSSHPGVRGRQRPGRFHHRTRLERVRRDAPRNYGAYTIEEAVMSLRDPNVVNAKSRKRVAIVIANPAKSASTGWPAGFSRSELTHPYYILTKK